METNNYENEEISLRDLIEYLLKGKWIIFISCVIAIFLAGIYTFILIPEKYEAQATLTVATAVAPDSNSIKGIEDIVDFINTFPNMTVETFVEQANAPQILRKTIEDLDLRNDKGEYITVASLDNMIEIANINETNLITISVVGKDEELAAKIVNTMSDNFIEFTNQNSRKQSQLAALEIEKQLEIEEKNVETKSQAVVAYLAMNTSIDELSNELTSLIGQITTLKSEKNSLEAQVNSDKASLVILLDNSNIQNFKLNEGLKLYLEGDTAVQVIDIDLTKSSSNDLQTALMTIEITKVQNRLIQNISDMEAKRVKLEEMQKDLMELQTKLAEQDYKFNSLNRDLQLAKQTYDAYQQRHKEASVAAAANMGSNSIIITSEAMIPRVPISPNKMLNLAIGLVLGGMIGVFIALFKEYWKNSAA